VLSTPRWWTPGCDHLSSENSQTSSRKSFHDACLRFSCLSVSGHRWVCLGSLQSSAHSQGESPSPHVLTTVWVAPLPVRDSGLGRLCFCLMGLGNDLEHWFTHLQPWGITSAEVAPRTFCCCLLDCLKPSWEAARSQRNPRRFLTP
jgi:hypothetical protein